MYQTVLQCVRYGLSSSKQLHPKEPTPCVSNVVKICDYIQVESNVFV